MGSLSRRARRLPTSRCAQLRHLVFPAFECEALTQQGSAALTPRFISSSLHAQNIPSRLITWFGGGGIEFPSLGLVMGGNAVYTTLEIGLRLRPNFLPVDITYLELSLFEKWNAMEHCD